MKKLSLAVLLSLSPGFLAPAFANTFHTVTTNTSILSATSATGPSAKGSTATTFASGTTQSTYVSDFSVGTGSVSTASPNYIIAKFVEEYHKVPGHSSDNYPTLSSHAAYGTTASYTVYFSTANTTTGTGTYNWKITATTSSLYVYLINVGSVSYKLETN